jgi:hypothetical protein
MPIKGQTTLRGQLKAKAYTECIKAVPQVDWNPSALTHCAEKLQLLTFLSPVVPLGNTIIY